MSSLLAPLSSSAIVRVASVLGVIFSVLAGEAVALQTSNGSRVPETADVDVASLNKHAGGQILAMPLKRIDHRGVATPSIGRRFFKADVLGVFGAAYMAECMPLSSFFPPSLWLCLSYPLLHPSGKFAIILSGSLSCIK